MTADRGPLPSGRDHYPVPGICHRCRQMKPVTYGPTGETRSSSNVVQPALNRVCFDCIRDAIAGRPPLPPG